MNSFFSILWFRHDLRIADNPALIEAAQNGALLPIYIFDEESAGDFKMGAASRWWLHHSLTNLNKSLEGKLHLYRGKASQIIATLIQKNKINAVYWNRCYEPWQLQQEAEVKTVLEKRNIGFKSFNASLLWEPWEVLNQEKKPYKVFTPFFRQAASNAFAIKLPWPAPKKIHLLQEPIDTLRLEDLELLPQIKWDASWSWKTGEQAAQQKLADFLKNNLGGYQENRNEPACHGVSGLSPHLHFGEIGPRQVWHATKQAGINTLKGGADSFLRELAWREFCCSLLYHFPTFPDQNFQKKFDHFPWKADSNLLRAWQQGKTGYPLVDAGMRELWQTGNMHNRVRMVVASFLVKNLGIHWKDGAAWFWDCLVDADLASNSANWQWVAGSGADAAPYFRIFNPTLQGEKFDKEGAYTRHFLPELARLPKRFLFKPWEAPDEILKAAGITLGKNYPHPIVSFQASREEALKAYQNLPSSF